MTHKTSRRGNQGSGHRAQDSIPKIILARQDTRHETIIGQQDSNAQRQKEREKRAELQALVPLLAKGQRNEAIEFASISKEHMYSLAELVKHQDSMVSENAAYCFELMAKQGIDISPVTPMLANLATQALEKGATGTAMNLVKALEVAAEKGCKISIGSVLLIMHVSSEEQNLQYGRVAVAASDALVAALKNEKLREDAIKELCRDLTEYLLDYDLEYSRRRDVLMVLRDAAQQGADLTSALPTLLDFSLYADSEQSKSRAPLSQYFYNISTTLISNKNLQTDRILDMFFDALLFPAKVIYDNPTARRQRIIKALRSAAAGDEEMRDRIVRKIYAFLNSKPFMKETGENSVAYTDTIPGLAEILKFLHAMETHQHLGEWPWD